MATSQNGWPVLFSPPAGTMPYITGRIRPNDVDDVFTYLCSRLDQIENNNPAWSWGWAVRAVRGQTSGYSNHASATAIDYNAPAHPLGVTGTWTNDEIRRIHQILDDLDGVIRWGEDYSGRKDGMHFEINDDWSAVHAVAVKIRNKQMPDQKPDWEPRKARAIHFGQIQEQFLIAAGAQKGKVEKKNGIGLIQQALNKHLGTNLVVDGVVGRATLNAWGEWEERVGGRGRPRVPDRISTEQLVKRARLELAGDPWKND